MEQARFNQLKRQIKRGNFRLAAKEYDGAIEAFQKARDLLPESVEILITLGKISLNLGRYDEAIMYFREALSIEESDMVYSNLGVALTIANHWEEAYEVLSNVKEPDTLAKYCLGISSLYIGKVNEKTDSYLRMRVDEVKFPGLALYYHKTGQHNKAIKEFRNFGGSWKIYHSIGVENMYIGSLSSAHSYFTQAYNRYLETVPISDHDEKILQRLEFDKIVTQPIVKERIRELKTFAENYPSFMSYYSLAATEYEISGYSKQFKEYLQKAVDLMEEDELDMDDVNYWLSQVEE